MKRNYLKILLPPVLAILLFILTIFYIIIPRYQESIMNGKREMIKELTNSAWSILSKYENDERDSLYTREEAQKTAASRIQYLRYGEENKDYFWITDMRPYMVMHPFREDLNGKDLSDFTDPHGKRLFVEFVETVKRGDHGYVDYMWQWKDDSLHIVPKLSYVRIFKPWGWVIGTGIYIEDVQKEINALTRRLLIISMGITLIIALLLLYISHQSLNTERKRILAENELKESKERYKALVEAATEGLIMLSDGKISFSNNVIGKMTGFSGTELLGKSISDMVSSNNNQDIIAAFSQGIVKEGQFELNLVKNSGGTIEVAVTASVALFYGKQVNILIVKDISIDRFQGYSNIDYHKLIGTLDLGFFKARIDNTGKFIYANETALKIFGFDNFKDLADVNFLRFLSDPADLKNLRKSLLADGYIKNKIIRVQNKQSGHAIVSLSMVVLNENTGDYLLCDGIIEDITEKESERESSRQLIYQLKSDRIVTDMPVEEFCVPAVMIDTDSTIGDAAEIMTKRDVTALAVTRNRNQVIGIVTRSDLSSRVLPLGLNAENPLYLIMTSPVVYADARLSAGDAIALCKRKNIDHLMVKPEGEKPLRIFSTAAFYSRLTGTLHFLNDQADHATGRHELRSAYTQLRELVCSLVQNHAHPQQIMRINSSFSDVVIRRAITLAMEEIGEAPVAFSFICMGSEGRMEESLLTDQDNAIIYEDPQPGLEENVRSYFLKLGEKVCDTLHFTGYSYCRGNIMAKNPQWNQPLSRWLRYFENWITTPEPQNLLDAIIFFDFRNVHGDEQYTTHLRNHIDILLEKQNVFLFHLAHNAFNTKVPQVSPGENTDLKACLSHMVMFARTYALQNRIHHTNTIDRLNELKINRIIAESTIDDILYAYHFLMDLRLQNQASQLSDMTAISNILSTKKMSDLEFSHLKKVLTQIPAFQNKIALDFRLKNVH